MNSNNLYEIQTDGKQEFRSRCNFSDQWCGFAGFQIISLNHHYHHVLQGTFGIFIYDPTLDKYIWWILRDQANKKCFVKKQIKATWISCKRKSKWHDHCAQANQSDMIITVSAILMQPGRARSSLFPPWQDNQIKSTI